MTFLSNVNHSVQVYFLKKANAFGIQVIQVNCHMLFELTEMLVLELGFESGLEEHKQAGKAKGGSQRGKFLVPPKTLTGEMTERHRAEYPERVLRERQDLEAL